MEVRLKKEKRGSVRTSENSSSSPREIVFSINPKRVVSDLSSYWITMLHLIRCVVIDRRRITPLIDPPPTADINPLINK